MAPFYMFCFSTNDGEYQSLVAQNESNLKTLEEAITDANLNLGETEQSEALISKANYLAQIGDKDLAVAAYEAAVSKTVPLGTRIDLLFVVVRIGFFYQDSLLVKTYIDKVKEFFWFNSG